MPAAEPPRTSALSGHVAEGAYGTGGGATPGVILAERRGAALAQINGAGEPAGLAALCQTLVQANGQLDFLWVVDNSGSMSEEIDQVLTSAQSTPIYANTRQMNGATVAGTGVEGDLWRGA